MIFHFIFHWFAGRFLFLTNEWTTETKPNKKTIQGMEHNFLSLVANVRIAHIPRNKMLKLWPANGTGCWWCYSWCGWIAPHSLEQLGWVFKPHNNEWAIGNLQIEFFFVFLFFFSDYFFLLPAVVPVAIKKIAFISEEKKSEKKKT